MTEFHSNKEFFNTLRDLIYRWCNQHRLQPLALVLPNYLAFNGLNDGWHELHASLKSLRTLGPEGFAPDDWATINDLIQAVDKMLNPP